MAKLFYDPINGGTALELYDSPQVFEKTDLEEARDDLLNVKDIPDGLREDIARQGLSLGIVTLPAITEGDPAQPNKTLLELFDDIVEEELDRVSDLLDYFDYDKGPPPIGNVAESDLFLPEAIEDFTDETVGGEAAGAIDDAGGGDPNDPDNSTYWQSESSGLRTITFRLRSYSKKVLGIRLRTNNGDLRAALQGLTIRAANSLLMIDEPQNELITGLNLDGLTTPWTDIEFTKAKCRYIRLETTGGLHLTNPDDVRIRTLLVRVGIINHK